jgi:hypothetical protein
MPRDLAGLAALGALGMMMANRKKGADRDTDTGVDVQPSYGQKPMTAAMSPMKDTEFGDLEGAQDAASSRAVMDQFNANEQAKKPSRSSMAKVQSAVRNSPPDVGSKGTLGTMMRLSPDAGKVGRRFHPEYPEEAEKAVAAEAKAKTPKSTYRSPFTGKEIEEDATPTRSPFTGKTYKKGGVIKMAKGGVTSSASARADGIAQKGKTRGKVC